MPREVKDAAGNVAIVVFENGEIREQSRYGRIVLKIRGNAVHGAAGEVARVNGNTVENKHGRAIAKIEGSSVYRHPNGTAIARGIEHPVEAAAVAAYLLLL
jgi:hypothetical protein